MGHQFCWHAVNIDQLEIQHQKVAPDPYQPSKHHRTVLRFGGNLEQLKPWVWSKHQNPRIKNVEPQQPQSKEQRELNLEKDRENSESFSLWLQLVMTMWLSIEKKISWLQKFPSDVEMIIFGSRIGQNPTGTAFSAVSQTSMDLWLANEKFDLSTKSAQNEGFFTWTWVRLADMANRITSQDNSTAQPMSKMPAPLRRWPLPPPQQRAVPARRPAKSHPFRLDWLEQQKFLDSLQPYVADSQESSRKALRLTCLTLGRVVIDSDEKNAELESSKSYKSSKKLRSTWVPTIHKSNQWKKTFWC